MEGGRDGERDGERSKVTWSVSRDEVRGAKEKGKGFEEIIIYWTGRLWIWL